MFKVCYKRKKINVNFLIKYLFKITYLLILPSKIFLSRNEIRTPVGSTGCRHHCLSSTENIFTVYDNEELHRSKYARPGMVHACYKTSSDAVHIGCIVF